MLTVIHRMRTRSEAKASPRKGMVKMRPEEIYRHTINHSRAGWDAVFSTLLVSIGAGLAVANAVLLSAGGAVA